MKPILISADPAKRIADLKIAHTALDNLPRGKEWSVSAEESGTRRQAQNELLWCWHREWAWHNGERVEWAHASTKYELLLPIKMAGKSRKHAIKGRFENYILSHVPNYEHRIGAAYEQIRSKDIPVKMFAEWLNVYQQMAADHGVRLASIREDLRDAALMEYAEKLAA